MSYIPPLWEWQLLEVLATCGFVAYMISFYLLWKVIDLEDKARERDE